MVNEWWLVIGARVIGVDTCSWAGPSGRTLDHLGQMSVVAFFLGHLITFWWGVEWEGWGRGGAGGGGAETLIITTHNAFPQYQHRQ